jgi:hypothetical protein
VAFFFSVCLTSTSGFLLCQFNPWHCPSPALAPQVVETPRSRTGPAPPVARNRGLRPCSPRFRTRRQRPGRRDQGRRRRPLPPRGPRATPTARPGLSADGLGSPSGQSQSRAAVPAPSPATRAPPSSGIRGPRPSPRRRPRPADSQGLQVLELLQLLRVVPPPPLLSAPPPLLLRRLPRPPRAPHPRVVALRPGRHRGTAAARTGAGVPTEAARPPPSRGGPPSPSVEPSCPQSGPRAPPGGVGSEAGAEPAMTSWCAGP